MTKKVKKPNSICKHGCNPELCDLCPKKTKKTCKCIGCGQPITPEESEVILEKQATKLVEALRESNHIENEFSELAFEDALKAWNYLQDVKMLTPDVILKVHKILMRNLRPDIAGKWRTCDVWIGGEKKKFVSVKEIERLMEAFCLAGFIANMALDDKEKFAKDEHIKFEDLHPHEDGNGRVGRLIYQWRRLQLGLQVHVIHADLNTKGNEGEQRSYYNWFKKLDK
jgi:Fic family protein